LFSSTLTAGEATKNEVQYIDRPPPSPPSFSLGGASLRDGHPGATASWNFQRKGGRVPFFPLLVQNGRVGEGHETHGPNTFSRKAFFFFFFFFFFPPRLTRALCEVPEGGLVDSDLSNWLEEAPLFPFSFFFYLLPAPQGRGRRKRISRTVGALLFSNGAAVGKKGGFFFSFPFLAAEPAERG